MPSKTACVEVRVPFIADEGTSQLHVETLAVRRLRNIQALDLRLSPRLNVIVGDNGHGKTSVLEAIYLAATTKSFRADRLATVIQEGAEGGSSVVCVVEGGVPREQRLVLTGRSRSARVDGKAPSTLSAYATRTPVVAFCPGDLTLVGGSASGRRRLLDRVMLFVDPPGAESRARYDRALRSRQRVLAERGVRSPDLDAFEAVMATEGSRFSQARARAAERVLAELGRTFERVAARGTLGASRYQAGGVDDPALFARRLAEARPADMRRGAASFGPQRDELEITLLGRPARTHGSQGQQRLFALALKLAELECIRAARGADPVLLLDDVSSELDQERTLAVIELVAQNRGQIFVTTTRLDLVPTGSFGPSERSDFRLIGGAVAAAPPGADEPQKSQYKPAK